MTERSISIERLYTLGDYKNIKVISSISEVPEKIDISLLFQQLTLECDLAYENYKEQNEKRQGIENVKAFLKQEHENILQALTTSNNEKETE